MANIVVSGALGKDPQFFEAAVDGKPRRGVRGSVADSILVRGQEQTVWYEFTVWARDDGRIPSENVFKNSKQGDIVCVQGRSGVPNIYLDKNDNPACSISVSVEPGGFTSGAAALRIQAEKAAGGGASPAVAEGVRSALQQRLAGGNAATPATPAVGGKAKGATPTAPKKKGAAGKAAAGPISQLSDEEAERKAAAGAALTELG